MAIRQNNFNWLICVNPGAVRLQFTWWRLEFLVAVATTAGADDNENLDEANTWTLVRDE
jgi:hypothetical protein